MSDDAKEMIEMAVGGIALAVGGYWLTVLMFCM
jgi:hypothetical protein